MFPRRAVASVTGIGGFAGMMAAMGFQRATGYLLETSGGNYQLIFNFLGLAYLLALGIIHLLVPRLETAELK
jgi:ACS family hexuronate transporter-like MFS transporter